MVVFYLPVAKTLPAVFCTSLLLNVQEQFLALLFPLPLHTPLHWQSQSQPQQSKDLNSCSRRKFIVCIGGRLVFQQASPGSPMSATWADCGAGHGCSSKRVKKRKGCSSMTRPQLCTKVVIDLPPGAFRKDSEKPDGR